MAWPAPAFSIPRHSLGVLVITQFLGRDYVPGCDGDLNQVHWSGKVSPDGWRLQGIMEQQEPLSLKPPRLLLFYQQTLESKASW